LLETLSHNENGSFALKYYINFKTLSVKYDMETWGMARGNTNKLCKSDAK